MARSRAARRLAVAMVVGVACAFVALIGFGAWALLGRAHVDTEPGVPVRVVVEPGASTASIASRLTSEGVVANPHQFRLRVRLAGADGRLRAGAYEFMTGSAYGDVIDTLLAGPPERYVNVTIPEGFVVEQIAERLEKSLGIPPDETLALARGGADRFVDDHPYLASAHEGSLEGYLFPKTYRFREGTGPEEALRAMLRQFDKEIAGVDVAAAERAGLSLHELVTLASMIEREARLESERPLISSVIHNRLRKGMRLEIDATIEYVLPGNRFRLTYRDLETDSPFNTYRRAGLPPGPIASPGLSSLKAAAEPADSAYLYYVLTGKDGSHTFAVSKQDFLRAKQRSKEVFGR